MTYGYKSKKTKRGHINVGGVVFESWQTGIMQFRLISTDGRCTVGRNYERSTYFAAVDGVTVGRLYRTETTALQAAFDKAYA